MKKQELKNIAIYQEWSWADEAIEADLSRDKLVVAFAVWGRWRFFDGMCPRDRFIFKKLLSG